MKKIMFATAALVAFASAAAAFERPTVVGYGEYSVEAESIEIGAGAEFVLADRFLLTPMFVGTGDTGSFDFDHAALNVSYGVNKNFDVYGGLTTDADFNYSDLVIGVKVQY